MLKKIQIISLILLLTGCSNNLPMINNLNDLENRSVGVYTGSEYDTILSEKIVTAEPKYYNSYSDQISALKSGKIDGFLTDEPLAKEILKQTGGLKVLDEKLTNDSYAFAINPDEKELQEKINNIIVTMKNDGTIDKFAEKWFGDDEEVKKMSSYSYDDSNGLIKFATVSGSAPFAYMKNNEIVGYDIEIIMYICKELGYKLEIVEMSFDGIIPALVSGKVDVAGCSIIVTEERKKSVLFSESNYTGGIVVVTRED